MYFYSNISISNKEKRVQTIYNGSVNPCLRPLLPNLLGISLYSTILQVLAKHLYTRTLLVFKSLLLLDLIQSLNVILSISYNE